jgi:hypothetical protein
MSSDSQLACHEADVVTRADCIVPRDGRLISLILASKGVQDADERVLQQLMDFSYRELPPFHYSEGIGQRADPVQGIQRTYCKTRKH